MACMTRKIRLLEDKGYKSSFSVVGGQLSVGHEIFCEDDEISLDATYRIEAESDPNNQAIIYAISCKNPKVKGLLINSFGIYADPDIDEFIHKIDVHRGAI